MTRRLATIAVLALAVFGTAAAIALSFGTVNQIGQKAEHEKITRAALACASANHPNACFQSWTISQLAGAHGSLGAVGAPDIDEAFNSTTHCDNADFFDVAGYPRAPKDRDDAFLACRAYARHHLTQAVKAAKKLLDNRGRIDRGETDLVGRACAFVGQLSGRAKCNVLDQFGRTLHTTEDFYSHSNWADEAAPGPTSVTNPPGLANAGLTPLFDWNGAPIIDHKLTGGCFGGSCKDRVTHEVINKDEGTINNRTGAASAPTTPRGKIGTNFARAVAGAVGEAGRQWNFLQNELVDEYGKRKGHLMICALTHDHPVEDCQVKLTIEGRQTVVWLEDLTFEGGCGGHVTGQGRTLTTFKSTEPIVASPVDLIPPELDGNPLTGFVATGVTLPTRATLTSNGTINAVGPECAGGGTPTPPDCGTKKINLPLEVLSKAEDMLTLRNAKDPVDPFKNCPSAGTRRGLIGPDDAELDSDDLFDEEVGKLIVKGKLRHTDTQVSQGTVHGTVTIVTSLDWELTIEKPPPAEASAAKRRRW